jgi:hypothetical protein
MCRPVTADIAGMEFVNRDITVNVLVPGGKAVERPSPQKDGTVDP